MKNLKNSIVALSLGLTVSVVNIGEAGFIPVDKVPLYTHAVRKIYCYLSPNGAQKGWIDQGDYVIVTKMRSDGWSYGSYPTKSGRVYKWFRTSELVYNSSFSNQERYSPKNKTNVYNNSSYNGVLGSVNGNEPILVVSDNGDSRQLIYKLSNGHGYKMGWMPYWDCWNADQVKPRTVVNSNPKGNSIVKPVTRNEPNSNAPMTEGVKNGINAIINKSNIASTQDVKDKIWKLAKYTDGFKEYGYYKEGGQCKGFATKVYKELFNINIGGQLSDDNFQLTYCNDSYIIGQVIEGYLSSNPQYFKGLKLGKSKKIPVAKQIKVSSGFVNDVKNLFKKSKPGCFVQMGRRKTVNSICDAASPHSAILFSVDDYGVEFYEANVAATDMIKLQRYNWTDLMNANLGFTVYAPNSYTIQK